jgi:DNA helicase-4
MPDDWQASFGRHLELKFSSVHGSKGLEANYVILPRVVNTGSSFPSMQTDDPVLQLSMPSGGIPPPRRTLSIGMMSLSEVLHGT